MALQRSRSGQMFVFPVSSLPTLPENHPGWKALADRFSAFMAFNMGDLLSLTGPSGSVAHMLTPRSGGPMAHGTRF